MKLHEECLSLAASSKDEVCGLIINDAHLFICRNIHEAPELHFRISDSEWLEAEGMGEITGIFHSHPPGQLCLSALDRREQLMTDLPWWLASDGRLRIINPVPHLLGRRFIHGKADCYSMVRDVYHLGGIDLPDFSREYGWWMRNEDLYMKNVVACGFCQVSPGDALPGDMIILQPNKDANPCHAMILLDDDIIIHHQHSYFVSRREPYRLAYVKQTHSVWRHQQCSHLNLAGVYADISARSF